VIDGLKPAMETLLRLAICTLFAFYEVDAYSTACFRGGPEKVALLSGVRVLAAFRSLADVISVRAVRKIWRKNQQALAEGTFGAHLATARRHGRNVCCRNLAGTLCSIWSAHETG
jgi:hypothetical protein